MQSSSCNIRSPPTLPSRIVEVCDIMKYRTTCTFSDCNCPVSLFYRNHMLVLACFGL